MNPTPKVEWWNARINLGDMYERFGGQVGTWSRMSLEMVLMMSSYPPKVIPEEDRLIAGVMCSEKDMRRAISFASYSSRNIKEPRGWPRESIRQRMGSLKEPMAAYIAVACIGCL